MALINCPECGQEVSDQATSCPHCGYGLNEIAGPTQPKPRFFLLRMLSPKVYCTNCHYTGRPGRVGVNAGNCLIMIILFCCFIIPGIIYMIYIDSKSAEICCKKCKNKHVIKV